MKTDEDLNKQTDRQSAVHWILTGEGRDWGERT